MCRVAGRTAGKPPENHRKTAGNPPENRRKTAGAPAGKPPENRRVDIRRPVATRREDRRKTTGKPPGGSPAQTAGNRTRRVVSEAPPWEAAVGSGRGTKHAGDQGPVPFKQADPRHHWSFLAQTSFVGTDIVSSDLQYRTRLRRGSRSVAKERNGEGIFT